MADDFTSGFLAGQGDNSFGGDWLWIIVVFALLFGWGRNGGGIGGNGGVMDGYVLTSDFANIERKLDGVNNGICSLGYDQLAQMNGINSNIANLGMSMQAGFNAASTQLANCCCENRAATADLKYTMATDTCATNSAIANATRDIIDAGNANSRAILDALAAQQTAALQEKINTLNADNQALRLAASQAQQNQYLVNTLRPSPVPAFCVTPPWQYSNGCGCSSCA